MRNIKLFYLLLIPLVSWSFQSCNDDDDDNSYDEWRKENETYIGQIKSYAENPQSEYHIATIPQGPGPIYYKIIKGAEHSNGAYPIYTSKVKVHYKGSLIDGTVFDDASARTVELNVNGVVKGFAVALQNMQIGEKWEIYIPWELGYGTSGSGSTISPYSALIFEVELIEIN